MKQIIIVFEFKLINNQKTIQFKDLIRRYGTYAFITNNSCMIWTIADVVSVRNFLMAGLASDDKLFVSEVSAPAAWSLSLAKEVSDYIIKNLKEKTL